jgi:hypothetical protein
MFGQNHYEFVGVFIPHGEEFTYECHYEYGMMSRASFTCYKFHPLFKPGPELQKLIDLGYTEEQGVTMLDALNLERSEDDQTLKQNL